ncbi:peptidase M23 [Streptomyces sp. NBC_01180]|uniref:peptidase M23 n=1 Tax=Streptomyces sp. NBC_01180 TaxID=2903763 RepID=UPI00386CE170|nr:peptidase M23 [Streptomyces sp. NBC_01180]
MQYRRALIAAGAVTLTAGALLVAPSAQAADAQPASKTVYVYATSVHLREAPRTSATVLATVSHIHLTDWCQTNKNTTPVADPSGGTNTWWSKVTLTTGSDDAWVSNVFLQGGRKIAGVPDC